MTYFENPYPDFDAKLGVSSVDQLTNVPFWIEYIKDTAFLCIDKLKPKARREYCDGAIYTANLGVIFMAFKVLKSTRVKDHEHELKKYMLDCLKANEHYYAERNTKTERDVAFFLGKGGLLVMGCLVSHVMNDQENLDNYVSSYASLASICEPVDFLSRGSDEIFVGRAGYLCGVLFLRKYLNIEVLAQDQLFRICDAMIKSGRLYSKKYGCPSALMYAYHGSEYLGNAHGLSGILQILLSFPEYLKENPEAERDVRQSVDFLLSLQRPNGNFPSSMDEQTHQVPRSSSKELVHWCHGAGGVIFMLAKAYLHWKDPRYLEACAKCADLIWHRGLLVKGPGICHGIGGGGLAFLTMYRLTNDAKYLYRAAKFADFLNTGQFKMDARTPDSPFSLFEGLAGTVCFIVDLLDPTQAEYPLVPVF